jgi:tripartite-type tricarboxylate transporter receptor subunit TctC
MNLFRILSALLTGAFMVTMTLPAAADAIADFYSGKQISLIIGYGTGGGYDLYARLLTRFIGDPRASEAWTVREVARRPATRLPIL